MRITEHYTLTFAGAIFWLFLILAIPFLINVYLSAKADKKKRLKSLNRIDAAWTAVERLPVDAARELRRTANDEFYSLLSTHLGLWPKDMTGNMARYRGIYNEHLNDW